jgi:hypothetical protein
MEHGDVQNRSVPELTAQLGEQLTRLARAELALAKAELFASARQAILGGGLFTVAALVGLGGWLALVAAAITGIAEVLPAWASALIVGAALTAVAGALALLGRARLARATPPLPMTTRSVRSELHALTSRPKQNGGTPRR